MSTQDLINKRYITLHRNAIRAAIKAAEADGYPVILDNHCSACCTDDLVLVILNRGENGELLYSEAESIWTSED